MKYLIVHDKNERDTVRWYLKAPTGLDGKAIDEDLFMAGRPLSVGVPLQMELRRQGEPRDFTLADFEIPVLRKPYADCLARLYPADVQSLPVRIDGTPNEYCVLNLLVRIPCLDEDRSTFVRWGPSAIRPELVGKYMYVTKIRISSTEAAGHDLLRIKDWASPIVISERAASCFEGASGAYFQEASDEVA
jgi:hypothetical protein